MRASTFRSHVVPLVTVLAASTATAHADVLLVAPSGTPHTSIASAVAAASDGDIVVVRQAQGGGFEIQAKSLTIVAEFASHVVCDYVVVSDLGASQHVKLVGLRTPSTASGSFPLFQVNQCAGSVHVVDCEFVAPTVNVPYEPEPPVAIVDCADVVLDHCTVVAYENLYTLTTGSVGVRVDSSSSLSLFDTSVTGGDGLWGESGAPSAYDGGPGRPAVLCKSSTLFVSGGTLIGGSGGPGANGVCDQPPDLPTSGGRGGPAIGAEDFGGTASFVRVLDASLAGGAGGAGGANPCTSAPNGASGAVITGASFALIAGSHRSMTATTPEHEGQSIALFFSGLPGDRVFLAAGDAAVSTYLATMHGPVCVQPPLRRVFVGVVGASGTLDVALPVGELGPGVLGRVKTIQGIFVDVANERWTSGPAGLVTLDAAF